MAIAFFLDGALLPYQSVRLTGTNPNAPGGVQGLPSSAWYGEPMTAGVVIEDSTGALDIDGWHTFWVNETSCSKPRIFTGWITGKAISRGSYRNGAGRIWNCDIIDQNALFSFEVFRAQSAQRPAETDLARVTFAQASAPMAFTPAYDNGRFNTTDNPVNFGDSNYVGQYPAELFLSVAGTSGKNFYAYWSDADSQISLHYDLVTANPASTLRISNVAADVDSTTTFAPFIDAELRRSPEDIYTGILFNYRGAYAYGRRQATIDAYSPTAFSPIEWHRDLVYQTDRVGRLETAQALINSMLEVKSTEIDDIFVTVQLPATKVNLIHAGDKVDVKFSHLPGYESFTSLAVIRRNVVPTEGHDSLYDVHLELSNRSAPRGPGGEDPGNFPPPVVDCDVDNVSIVQTEHASVSSPGTGVFQGASWPAPPTAGNVLVSVWMHRANQSLTVGTMPGWAAVPDTASFVGAGGSGGKIEMFWKVAESSEDTTPQSSGGDLSATDLDDNNHYLMEIAGIDSFDTSVSGSSEVQTTDPGVSITPRTGVVAVLITAMEHHQGVVGTPGALTEHYNEGNISDGGNPGRGLYSLIVSSTSGSYDANPTFSAPKSWASVTAAFYCSGTDPDAPCVASGQPSPEDEPAIPPTGDGTTTTFETRCPFADGTLRVKVDDLDQTAAITDYDGAAGTFTLGFAPVVGEQITVNYLGR